MKPIIFDFPHSSLLGNSIRKTLAAEEGKIILSNFPDGETYLRILTNVQNRNVIINASLFYPNDWILSLFFLADALHAQGAKHVGLLAPYLSYMRQDKIFQPGEALTSKTFANLLSSHFNYLITVDPHLHRYHDLGEIYSIPSTVVKAAPLLSHWISTNLESPFLIGPDNESCQWVQEIAKDSPYIVLDKIRHENGQIQITWPIIGNIENMTPVLVDDIISSGVTMIQAIQHVKTLCTKAPVCMAIHPIFANDAYQKLQDAGVDRIITSNSISHPSNQIDLSALLASSLEKILNKI
jgi:ribose-phosphate pyrophosphokinase